MGKMADRLIGGKATKMKKPPGLTGSRLTNVNEPASWDGVTVNGEPMVKVCLAYGDDTDSDVLLEILVKCMKENIPAVSLNDYSGVMAPVSKKDRVAAIIASYH
jgi:hypothetical protein